MKKSFIILVLMAFAIMPTKADNLKQGEKLVKSLELEFDEQAKTDDVFISWELSGDWDKFDYSFSQGTLEDNVFTIRANEYKGFVNGHEGIALTIEGKSKTEEGDYNLSLRVKEVDGQFGFPQKCPECGFSDHLHPSAATTIMEATAHSCHHSTYHSADSSIGF